MSKESSSPWCLIHDLSPINRKSAIKLRLIRIYGVPSSTDKKEIVNLICLFHDLEGERISATIPRNSISLWEPLLKEGNLYWLKNFLVVHNTNKYKITTHKYKIKFNDETEVTRKFDGEFPNNIYVFKSFEEIEAIDETQEGLLIDVIGVLLTKGEIKYITPSNDNQKTLKLIDFMLQDTQGKRLSCTLWEDYVDQFLHLLEQNSQPSNIIILQCCRPTKYQGKIKACSTSRVTKILVNANIPEVADFKERVVIASDINTTIIGTGSEGTHSSFSNEQEDIHFELRTIEQLFLGDEIGNFWIAATVVGIDLDDGWFYISCKNCTKKLMKQDHKFYCEKCKTHDVSGNIRYKLMLNVVDEKESATLILWERECLQLIKKSAAELRQSDENSLYKLPDEIYNALMEKKFLFKVQLQGKKNSKYHDAYSVCKVTSDLAYINSYNSSHFDSQESNCMSKLENSDTLTDKIKDDSPMETPSSQSDVGSEWVDDGQLKRSLTDAFSSTISAKKSKVMIKQEKD